MAVAIDEHVPATDEEITQLLAWDRLYIDTAISREKLVNYHNPKVRYTHIVYFRSVGDTHLVGYCEWSISQQQIFIVWFLAPKNGFNAMKQLLEYFSTLFPDATTIRLGVTIDKHETPKAPVARLQLYGKFGFVPIEIEWDKLRESVCYVRMERRMQGCAECGKPAAFRCATCKNVLLCSMECWTTYWKRKHCYECFPSQ
jgi:hypothetical protein